MKQEVICVDFDGTIVEHRFPEIGAPVPMAIETLKDLQNLGYRLILYTMRSDNRENGDFLIPAVNYLKSNGINLFGINNNPEQDWTSSPKVYAQYYIDDAAVGCPLIYPENGDRPYVNWFEIRKYFNLL